ncbi:hypothetical protein [Aliiglaciecola litoralis]|uniref:PEP-CTERM protein-sorting domain-containing protein n=1 Tax=Aliiglaciecola litoralis TaxID=582857 RepID=A0ABN1LD90_9ALTE
MRRVISFFFLVVFSQGIASAAVIEYEFDTLTFTDNHQINGAFTYNTLEDRLIALSVSLFGPVYNIDFNIDDLASPDAFSIEFSNSIFGDSANEGFQLFKDDVLVATGQYGVGVNDTCYFDPETCSDSLFNLYSNSQVVDAPQPSYLLVLGLALLFRRKIFQ